MAAGRSPQRNSSSITALLALCWAAVTAPKDSDPPTQDGGMTWRWNPDAITLSLFESTLAEKELKKETIRFIAMKFQIWKTMKSMLFLNLEMSKCELKSAFIFMDDVKHVLICSSSRIELGDVTPHNIKQLKRLNQVIFPVSYNDKFYKDVLEVGELAKLAYFNDIAVGAVCCRVDHSQNQKRLYIMTLGCLAPYRRLGIGTKMLNHVLNICEKDGTFDNIYLHVQISNESAIDFYRKFGFEIIETKKNYYKRIEPADAHVLQKNLKAPCLGQNADVQKTDN
ncbi:hypothetical protein DV515_00010205 [Chloebia gouldiae]|uniref:N-alpha-acetyltransferase 50 n=234 Tax=Aves TaxID=8782 RepID=A0A3L8S9T1_CHLGU|nr:hypothetical protein DV515_00010205 [Chloebia gouldiae]